MSPSDLNATEQAKATPNFIELPCVACGLPTQVSRHIKLRKPVLCEREECIQKRKKRAAAARASIDRPARTVSEDAERNEEKRVTRKTDVLSKPREGKKRPSYLKSAEHHVVVPYRPDHPEAPYGYDENDVPIRLPRPTFPLPDLPICPEPSCSGDYKTCGCSECKEKRRTEEIRKDWRKREEQVAQPAPLTPQERAEREREVLLPHARKYLLSGKETKLPELGPAFVSLREVLSISRETILEWFNRVIRKKVSPSVSAPPIFPPDYVALQASIDDCRQRILGLEKETEGMSAKLRSDLDDQDEREGKKRGATRRAYRAQFKRAITQIKAEIADLTNQKRRKTLPTFCIETIRFRYHILDEGKRPKGREFECSVQGNKLRVNNDEYMLLLKEVIQWPSYTEKILANRDLTFGDHLLMERRDNWLKHYEGVLALRESATKEDSKVENDIIQTAINSRWCAPPSQEVLKRYPWIMNASYEKEIPLEHGDTDFENELIIKTGGASIGGQIVGAGIDKSGRQRGLSSFHVPLNPTGEEQGASEHNEALESDAWENPEEFDPQ